MVAVLVCIVLHDVGHVSTMEDMYPNREVFPNSPLALVAVEVRITDAARLRLQSTLDEIAVALESEFPVAKTVSPEGADETATSTGSGSTLLLHNRAKTEAVGFTSESFAFETTQYSDFSRLRSVVELVCGVLQELHITSDLTRIGLRYIDEIRVPEKIIELSQWESWVESTLVAKLDISSGGFPILAAQGATVYDLGEGKRLIFRFAALNQEPVVEPQVLRRKQDHESGPFFVLDFDGFHSFSANDDATFSFERIIEVLSAVHAPAGELFQRSITDKARELFRTGEGL